MNIEPGDFSCIDESISRWYGLGRCWIDVGLPCYVAIDSKPENGGEIQNIACGIDGFMFKIEFVKSESQRNLEIAWTSFAIGVTNSSVPNYKILTIMWVDRSRRYFVSTGGKTLSGNNQEHLRWLQENDDAPHQRFFSIPIPKVAEDYYSCAGRIDRHNTCLQDDINMERSFRVREWSSRVNTSLL